MANKKKKCPAPPIETGRVKTTAEAGAAQPTPAEPTPAQRSRRGGRETVDALVVAFVLAFLIRTFVAEMFVIPTGSMAPTLMGRHKDVFCVKCGTRYRINSSDESESLVAQVREGRLDPRDAQRRIDVSHCIAGQCPQCRYVMLVDDKGAEPLTDGRPDEGDQDADYSGDRLLVSKYAYSFQNPQRWDVAVFKYPGDSEVNYIKRVVGLPGEELRIFDGDLWTRPLDQANAPFEVARKPPEVVLAMSQMVHDTHHESAELIDAGWPLAWRGEDWSTERGDATTDHAAAVYRPTYRIDASGDQTAWLRYHHTPPGEPVWRAITGGQKADLARVAQPQLVTDHTPYNTQIKLYQAGNLGAISLTPVNANEVGRNGPHWVGDLIVEADLHVESEAGEVSLDLVEAGDHYGVTIDAATGRAEYWRRPFESDQLESLGEAETPLRGQGEWRLRLANVDNRLLLWVDGSPIGDGAPYDRSADGPATRPRTSEADPGDLAPAGVGARGADVVIERLVVLRDGYYIATRWDEQLDLSTDITPEALGVGGRGTAAYAEALLSLPQETDLWPKLAERRHVDFDIRDGQLFVMGDNSGFSLDARLWPGGNGPGGGGIPGGPYLEEKQLVGKAICVYWPHAWYSVPFTNRVVPAWPNIEDMRLVR